MMIAVNNSQRAIRLGIVKGTQFDV